MTQHVHWHEGLFLQPHHLQLMQQNFLEHARAERRLGWAYPYGVIEYSLSEDALRNMLVQFKHLRVVMPSGVEVDYPTSADLPPLNIQKAFTSDVDTLVVLIAVPLWDPNGPNAVPADSVDGWRSRRIYQLAEIDRPDENTGAHIHPIMIRRVNARLLLEGDDAAGMEVLPLLRITRAGGETGGLPVQDPAFIPPCLVIRGFPGLGDMVTDIANQVDGNRRDLMNRISRGGVKVETLRDAKFQYEHILFLQTLNRHSARLASLVRAPGITPFEMYLELRDLLGELATLSPGFDALDVPAYDHDRPGPSFFEVSQKIRTLLNLIASQRFRKVEFSKEEDIYVADLSQMDLKEGAGYFLAIETKEDPRILAKLVEDMDRFKVMAKSNIHQRVRGLTLREEREVPLDLPAKAGTYYFRILPAQNRALWRRIMVEDSIAVRFSGHQATDYKFSLFMTFTELGGGE